MYELHEILFFRPSNPKSSEDDANATHAGQELLGKLSETPRPDGPQATNGATGVTLRCQAAFSGQNKYLNNLYRSEVEIPSNKNMSQKPA